MEKIFKMIDDKLIIKYGGKNYLISKFSAYENIKFNFKERWGTYICWFSCIFDFSGSQLHVEHYFKVNPMLDEYENKKWFGFLPVSFRKYNPAYEFLAANACPRLTFTQETNLQNIDNEFCSEYINWIAEKLNAQQDLEILLNDVQTIFKQLQIKEND